MSSARELLEQADTLMRRNRAGVIDTEVPELREVVAMGALAPAARPTSLDDVPELTEAVEEIEIASIAELPEDIDESSGWLHHDHGELSIVGGGADVARVARPEIPMPAAGGELTRSALAVVGTSPADAPRVPVAGAVPVSATTDATTPAATANAATPAADARPPTADEWARWEVLADEIRMQVLQRIDIFTDTRLRDQLSAQLQPIVDRASAEMVATINERVGGLLRAYIAEAIEREIEKWREAPR